MTTLKIQYTAFYLDPNLHPSALTFHPIPEEPLLLIGLSNGSFYFKNTSKIELKNCFQKFHEQIHESSIDAIVCNMYNGRIISGDSKGKVVIWKPRQLSNIQSVAEFTVLFQFTVNKPILHLSLRTCNSDEEPHSLLITARNQTAGTLIMYDLISHEMRPFCLSNKGNEHDFSLANYSPDFKYVIAATQEGKVVLLDNSGMMRKHVSIV
jgi:WD40 repeat protein